MEFKEMLRQLREKAGLTQQELAEKASVSLGSIRNHEQGLRQPGWEVVMRLAKALGVSADAFADCDEVSGAKSSAGKAPAKPAAPRVKPSRIQKAVEPSASPAKKAKNK